MLCRPDDSVWFLYLLSHSVLIFFDIGSPSPTFNLLQKGPSLKPQLFSGSSSQVNQVPSSLLSVTSDVLRYRSPAPPPLLLHLQGLFFFPMDISQESTLEALSHFSWSTQPPPLPLCPAPKFCFLLLQRTFRKLRGTPFSPSSFLGDFQMWFLPAPSTQRASDWTQYLPSHTSSSFLPYSFC